MLEAGDGGGGISSLSLDSLVPSPVFMAFGAEGPVESEELFFSPVAAALAAGMPAPPATDPLPELLPPGQELGPELELPAEPGSPPPIAVRLVKEEVGVLQEIGVELPLPPPPPLPPGGRILNLKMKI